MRREYRRLTEVWLYRRRAKVKLDNVQDGVRKGEVEATVNTNAPESGQADRVLGEISKKLNKHMSIEYTVNELIRTARDPKNLAVIYSGKYRVDC